MITAIAWNPKATVNTGKATREILVGTQKGEILETWIEPTDDYFGKEERYVHLVYRLSIDNNDASSLSSCQIVGLYFNRLVMPSAHNNYIVMVTTANRVYQFMGEGKSVSASPSYDTPSASTPSPPTMFGALFARYTTNASFQELPGDIGWSSLYFYSPSTTGSGVPPLALFAWVTGPGIYQGRLALDAPQMTDDRVDNAQLIP